MSLKLKAVCLCPKGNKLYVGEGTDSQLLRHILRKEAKILAQPGVEGNY